MKPTKEQIEQYIKAARDELGTECDDEWEKEIHKYLREWVKDQSDNLGAGSVMYRPVAGDHPNGAAMGAGGSSVCAIPGYSQGWVSGGNPGGTVFHQAKAVRTEDGDISWGAVGGTATSNNVGARGATGGGNGGVGAGGGDGNNIFGAQGTTGKSI
jgi:hypothetical protein